MYKMFSTIYIPSVYGKFTVSVGLFCVIVLREENVLYLWNLKGNDMA